MIRSPIFPNISLCTTYLLLGVSGLFGEEVSSTKLSPLVSVAHPISNANISIIDDAFIANTQAQNLREIFNKNAEIQVGGSTQIAQKLYIRGFEDRMYRVRLDGITQSGNLFHHQGNLVLDPFLIKDIEIEKGKTPSCKGAVFSIK